MKRNRKAKLKINGTDVSHCLGFGYDGCHKIYLVENDGELEEARREGYTPLLPLSKLERTFVESCPFRFISWWNLGKGCIVPQDTLTVSFEDDKGRRVHNFNHGGRANA